MQGEIITTAEEGQKLPLVFFHGADAPELL